jgi:hypothetical protein
MRTREASTSRRGARPTGCGSFVSLAGMLLPTPGIAKVVLLPLTFHTRRSFLWVLRGCCPSN